MEIEGKIIMDLPLQSGISKAGNQWRKKGWVLETMGTYPRKVYFTVFGDRVDTILFQVGKTYSISVDVESREFNGRWYTDVNCYASREVQGQDYPVGGYTQAPQQPMPPVYGQPQAPAGAAPAASGIADPFGGSGNDTEDLPF